MVGRRCYFRLECQSQSPLDDILIKSKVGRRLNNENILGRASEIERPIKAKSLRGNTVVMFRNSKRDSVAKREEVWKSV